MVGGEMEEERNGNKWDETRRNGGKNKKKRE